MKGSSSPPGFPAAVSCSPLRRSQLRRVRFAPATGDRLSCFGLHISQQAAPLDRGSQVLQRCRAPFSGISQQGADGLVRPLLRVPPLGRLRPLLVGKPHMKRRMGRWDGDGVVRSAARHLTRF